MDDEKTIFRNLRPDYEKLKSMGFKKDGKGCSCDFPLVDDKFSLRVFVSPEGNVSSVMTDVSLNEPYTLHLVDSANGSFIGRIREAYLNTLNIIKEGCFISNVFSSPMSARIIAYCKMAYGSKLEFLWDDTPNIAVMRRSDNEKWFAVFFHLEKRKFGLDLDGEMDAVLLRMDQNEPSYLIDYVHYFPAYHMNKDNWLGVSLMGEVTFKKLVSLFENSREIALKSAKPKKK